MSDCTTLAFDVSSEQGTVILEQAVSNTPVLSAWRSPLDGWRPFYNLLTFVTSKPLSNHFVALVDWVAFTAPPDMSVDSVCSFLSEDEWIELSHGGMHYRKSRQCGALRVYYEGHENMGVHVELSGQACRQLEGTGRVQGWPEFFQNSVPHRLKFSRIDVAIDDKSGCLNMGTIWQSILDGSLVTRYREARGLEKLRTKDGSSGGRTIYFGSGNAETMVRFYDKAAEQKEAYHWVRCELQCRHRKAEGMAAVLRNSGFMDIVANVLRQLIDFKIPGGGKQKTRWTSSRWWDAFLQKTRKLSLALQGAVKTVQDAHAWIGKTVSATLAMVVMCVDDPVEYLRDLVREGSTRLTKGMVNRIQLFHRVKLAKPEQNWIMRFDGESVPLRS